MLAVKLNMAHLDEQQLIPSVLDRLIDLHPERSTDDPQDRSQVLRELKESVRRDLENLLNSKRQYFLWPKEYEELERSLANYGVADFTGATFAGTSDRANLARNIERTILQFEPRLVSVRVRLEETDKLKRQLRFTVDAMLQAYPSPEPVTFDSVLEPHTRTVSIKAEFP